MLALVKKKLGPFIVLMIAFLLLVVLDALSPAYDKIAVIGAFTITTITAAIFLFWKQWLFFAPTVGFDILCGLVFLTRWYHDTHRF